MNVIGGRTKAKALQLLLKCLFDEFIAAGI